MRRASASFLTLALTLAQLALTPVWWNVAVAGEEELYKDVETLRCSDGICELTRPDAEWVFIDLDVQRREAARIMTAVQLSEAFRGVTARLHHPGIKATVSTYTGPWGRGEDLAALEEYVKRSVQATGGQVTSSHRARVDGRLAVKIEYARELEEVGGQPGGLYHFSRVDALCLDEGRVVTVVLEVPYRRRKGVIRDFKAILGKLELGSPREVGEKREG